MDEKISINVARTYIDENSKEFYYLPHSCYFVGDPTITQMNEEGIELYKKVSEMAKNDKFKDILTDVSISQTRSGMWFNDKEHPYHKICRTSIEVVCNTYGNREANGIRENGEPWYTSSIVFMTENWIYTSRGSLYKVKNYDINYKIIKNIYLRYEYLL